MYKGSKKRFPRALFLMGVFVAGIIFFVIDTPADKKIASEREAAAIVFGIVLISYITYNVCKRIYIGIRNIKLYFDTYNDLDTMNREINVKYSPAVLSYLFNQKLEPKKDILATIVNLYNKKAIEIQKTAAEYKFLPNDNTDIKTLNLNSDEEYIYNCFVINKETFSIDKWNNIVKNEYNRYGFSRTNEEIEATRKKKKSVIITILILVIVVIAVIITWQYGDLLLADSSRTIPRVYTFIIQVVVLSAIVVLPVVLIFYLIRIFCNKK